MGIFDKGVKKTNLNFFQTLGRAITGKSKVDEDVLDALEEALLSSDMGVDTTLKVIENLEDRVEKDKYVDMEELVALIRDEIALNKKLNGLETEEFLCLECMAEEFGVTVEDLENRIEYFKESGWHAAFAIVYWVYPGVA